MPDDDATTPPATGDSQPASSWFELIAILSVLVLLVGGVAYWAMLKPRPKAKNRVVSVAGASGAVPRAEYVGSTSCKGCHPGEEALYHRSGHSRTLRAIAQTPFLQSLDGRSVADPERPGVTWSYRREGDGLTVDRRQGDAVASYPIDYALGSDRNAATLVAIVDADPARFRILEHRLTHYRDGDALRLTPGHGASAPADPAMKPYGRALSHEDSAKCVNCHATRTSAAGPDTPVVLAEMVPNVSCERCHGPAGNHVEAARRGATGDALKMPAGPGRQTAAEQMTLCGQCHHHPDRAFAGEIDLRNPNLARFQPVGLMQSKCYLKTEGHLSCTACHDPHDRPGTTASPYEATCLSCHTGPKSTVCKVSPKSGCIPCHMPKTPTAQGFPFTDHWIRVIRDRPSAKTPGRFVPDDAGG